LVLQVTVILEEYATAIIGNLAQVPHMSIEFNDISINTGVFRKSTIASHDRFNVVLEEQKVLFFGSKNRLIPI